jgi:biopolymer transport protein ExbD
MKIGPKGGVNFESKLDMTPLIDCIFQLILFLVLTSQITIQAEEVELPFALEGKEPDKEGKAEEVPPLIINVVRVKSRPGEEGERLGEIVYSGLRFGNSEEKLKKELKKEVDFDASPLGKGRGFEAGPGGRPLSKLSVLVRADKGVRSEYIRTIFMACQAVGIYRVRVSTTSPQP